MASTGCNANLTKKRYAFLDNFLSTKNLTIFGSKSSSKSHLSKYDQLSQSHHDILSEEKIAPVCLSRSWLKRHSQRPNSLNFDLFNNGNDITQQQSTQHHCGMLGDER